MLQRYEVNPQLLKAFLRKIINIHFLYNIFKLGQNADAAALYQKYVGTRSTILELENEIIEEMNRTMTLEERGNEMIISYLY